MNGKLLRLVIFVRSFMERLCQNDWTGILNEKGKGKWNEKDEIDKIGEILGFI